MPNRDIKNNNNRSLYDYISDLDDDPLINNPYLEALKEIVLKSKTPKGGMDALLEKRNFLVEEYSFSIPFPFVLDILKVYSPITELGAGTGYYSFCLKQMGVDIEAYDLYSPDDEDPLDFFGKNQWFNDTWTLVLSGDEEIVQSCKGRSLFLCWPPPDSLMAFNSLKVFEDIKGEYIIFIGDKKSSAEESFFKRLEMHELKKDISIPSWNGINERLLIYKLRN